MVKNLLTQYVDWASSSCDAPLIFHETVGYWVISTLLGRYSVIVTSYTPRGIRPNLWCLLIGPSRIVRKTTSMELGEKVIDSVEPELKIPASFSPEALYEILSGLEVGDCGCWIKDEFGEFFRSLQKKYMYGMRGILSSIYMGRGETRKLRNLTFKIPPGIYITAIGTLATPPHCYFSEDDFTSGLLNRFILAFSNQRTSKIPMLNVQVELDGKFDKLVSDVKEFVQHYRNVSPIPASFRSEVVERLREYEEWVEGEISRIEKTQPESIWKLYLAETPNTLLKLCVLSRIARYPLGETVLVVEKQDLERAASYMKKVLLCAQSVISDVQSSPKSREVVTEEKALNKVYGVIQSKGNGGVMFSELLSETRFLKQDLVKYLVTLVDQGKVIAVRPRSVTKGRRPLIFMLSEYESHASLIGDILTSETFIKVV